MYVPDRWLNDPTMLPKTLFVIVILEVLTINVNAQLPSFKEFIGYMKAEKFDLSSKFASKGWTMYEDDRYGEKFSKVDLYSKLNPNEYDNTLAEAFLMARYGFGYYEIKEYNIPVFISFNVLEETFERDENWIQKIDRFKTYCIYPSIDYSSEQPTLTYN